MNRVFSVTVMNNVFPRSFNLTSCRVEPRQNVILNNVTLECGSQMIRIPPEALIQNLILRGGASSISPWAVLRGGVLKFAAGRETPISIDGSSFSGGQFEIPPGYALLDQANLAITYGRNGGRQVPHQVIRGLASSLGQPEDLFLVHDSYCHPGELFWPQGIYSREVFRPKIDQIFDLIRPGETVFSLAEKSIKRPAGVNGEQSFNIFDINRMMTLGQPAVISLLEGGYLFLKNE